MFSQLSMLGSSVALLFALILLWRRSVHSYIAAFAYQSAALAGVSAMVAWFSGDVILYFVAALLLLIKLLALAAGVAVLETRVAKLRLFRVPELLTASFVLALLAVTSSFLVR